MSAPARPDAPCLPTSPAKLTTELNTNVTQRQGSTFTIIAGAVALVHALVVLLRPGTPMADLEVYRMGSFALAAGNDNLYSLTYVGPDLALPYTYPPFSTMVFTPLSLGPATPAAVVMAALIIMALARVSWLLASNLSHLPRKNILVTALIMFTLGWVGEPFRTLYGLGQVATILAWLVVEDWFGFGAGKRSGGVLTGVATGIKLIPGMFIATFAILGQWRRAGTALLTVLATVLIGAALLPESSRLFWSGMGFDASRVGGVEWAGNQSLNALAWRTFTPDTRVVWWLIMSLAAACAWLYLVRSYHRIGDDVAVILVTAVTGLLVSPVSWTHHWVWLAPAAVWLWITATRSRSGAARHAGRALAALVGVGMIIGPVRLVPNQESLEFTWNVPQWVVGHNYVIVGILILIWSVWNIRDKSAIPPRSGTESAAVVSREGV